MSRFNKVMTIMRSILINVAIEFCCVIGAAYMFGEIMYDYDTAMIFAFMWIAFSGYQMVLKTIREIREVVLYK